MTESKPVITLREITPANFEAIMAMRVHEDQKHMVASNAFSLAEAYVFRGRVPLAIYADEVPVGFLMYTFWEDRQQYWIFRLMIDKEHQHRGYGQATMRLLIERMQSIEDCRRIYISYDPENHAARALYTSLGFQITGEMVEHEEVACLDLP